LTTNASSKLAWKRSPTAAVSESIASIIRTVKTVPSGIASVGVVVAAGRGAVIGRGAETAEATGAASPKRSEATLSTD
jgi:hypothetical protein